MTEHNPAWRPIPPRFDAVELTLRTLWATERNPPRIAVSQRYSLVVTEPCPEPVWVRA